jgi:predicted Zn-dependent peptidase
MIEELDKVANDGITQDEFDLAMGNISGSLALKFESTQSRMSRLVSSEVVTGEFVDLNESLALFKAVTLDQIRDLAADIAGRERSIVAVGELNEKIFDEFL